MKFVDEAIIKVQRRQRRTWLRASFRREKYIPRGGPDGGDGGRRRQCVPGCRLMRTSIRWPIFRRWPALSAPGMASAGAGKERTGASGDDPWTVARAMRDPGLSWRRPAKSWAICRLLMKTGSLVAVGGEGGKGNTSVSKVEHKPCTAPVDARARPGESHAILKLELTVLADVGSAGLAQCRQIDPD